MSYVDILKRVDIEPLNSRRDEICKKYFNEMKREDHKLHHLLPATRNMQYDLRSCHKYPLTKCRTSRYKNSLIPWCLSYCQS